MTMTTAATAAAAAFFAPLSLRSAVVRPSTTTLRHAKGNLPFCRGRRRASTSATSHHHQQHEQQPQKLSRRRTFVAAAASRSSGGSAAASDSDAFTSTASSAPSSSPTTIDLDAWKSELSLEECRDLLRTAERAARAAGAIITSNLGCCSEQSEECDIKYSIKDIVTEYDKQAQAAIESIVRRQFPSHSFLGEEDVDPGAAASQRALERILQSTETGYVWICDPIDGTANFAAGLPLCAVTMGVAYKGTPVVGIIYDPHRDEMFSAVKGRGATLNGTPIQVSPMVREAKDALINAGCPADPNAFETSMRGVLALNGKSRGLRIVACSALTTAWIACGRLAAHFGYDLSSWDLVAGALLIQEAGGTVTDLDGSPYKLETRNMLCSNGLVHDEVLQVLRDADAVSFTRS